MLSLTLAALITAATHDRPVRDTTLGPWVVRQEEPGSPDRVLFTSVPMKGNRKIDLLLTCDGNFFLSVMGSGMPIYADDDEAVIRLADGTQATAPAIMTGHSLLHISATKLEQSIVAGRKLSIQLRRKDGTAYMADFELPDLSAGSQLMAKSCPAS